MCSAKSLSVGQVFVVCAAFGGSTVYGQAPPPDTGTIDEVIVTAQKRSERLIDVPISISAITGASMQDSGASQLADFLQTAPGVGIIDNASGTQTIQIRGINSVFGNAPVGYYLDELPFSLIGNTQVPDVRTYDLERLEILRGPQGTLYGDGSIGGTIRILTREPNLKTLQAGFDLTGSTTTDGDNSHALRGMLNVPLKEDVAAFRLVASQEELAGWIDNTGTGVGDQNSRTVDNYRGKIRWVPTDRLDMVFSAWHTKEDIVGNSNSLTDRTTPDPADTYGTEYNLYSATVRYHFDAFDLVSATSKMNYRNDSVTFLQIPIPSTILYFPFTDNETQDLLGEELRLTSNGTGIFRWTAGVFYRSMDRHIVDAIPDFAFTQDLTLESDSYAGFGEATWSLLDRKLDVTLGLRYFKDDRLLTEVIDPAFLALIQSVDPTFTGKVDESFTTTNPRLNVAYHLADDWMAYGNIAKGFRTGQPQPALSLGLAILNGVTVPTGIDPETLWSYEVGTKGTFADGHMTLEAAVYYNAWKDLQVPVVVAPQVRALVNGGTARTQGVEVGLTFRPTKGLSLQFSGGFVDAKFTEDVAGINIVSGDRIPGVPKTTLSAAATYRWPFLDTVSGFAHGSAQYTSERTDTVNLAPPSDSTTTVDLRFGIEGKSWAAYLYGDNVTDEDGAIDVLANPSGTATRLRPRTVGLNVRYNFN